MIIAEKRYRIEEVGHRGRNNREKEGMKSTENIYRRALEKFGVRAQIGMVFEEMSELQKELCKHMRGKNNIQEITEEIADVEIMIGQMKELFNIGQAVDEEKEWKIRRLKKLLDREDG
ncbi:MAG: hypothetical protein PHS04_13975 [Tissierellia bacterium]|nr:hypothetical protein [Tissierellia bacterium]